ncbi:MAG: DUF5011 domain-containing protein [Chlorobi bacterium]|nr:DUF5011 domain-containing protein [Chlorobiota bacterium]
MKKLFIPLLVLLAGFVVFSGCKKDGDKNKPYIIILGSNPLTWQIDIPYVDPGAEAYDITEAGDTVDITSRLQVNSNVNVSVAGKYSVEYNVSDEAGNAADPKTRTVNVILTK